MVKVTEIQNNAKDIMPFLDLYGNEILFKTLQKYPFVSWCNKSIPKDGSPTRLSKDIDIKKANELKVKKLVAHRDGKTTIITDKGTYQFFAAGQQLKTKKVIL